MARLSIIACVVAAAITAAGGAGAAPCAKPADDAGFAMIALRSRMMVLALGCKADPSYNAALERFKAEFVGGQQDLDAYFSRTRGRQAARDRDAYVTLVANAQSLEFVRDDDRCDAAPTTFAQVMNSTPAELPALARTIVSQHASWPLPCSPAKQVASTASQKRPAAVRATLVPGASKSLGGFDPTAH